MTQASAASMFSASEVVGMARKTRVRSDAKGIYVRADGRVFRPGSISSLVMVDMSDGGLLPGAEVHAAHVSGTTRCRVTTSGGAVLNWHTDYQHKREAERIAELEAMWARGVDPQAAVRANLQRASVRDPHHASFEDPDVREVGPSR